MRRLVLPAALLAVVALAACSGGSDDGGGNGEGSVGGARADDGPVDWSSLADVCAGDILLTRATPYTGPPPHPVTVLGPPPGNAPDAQPYTLKLLDVAAPLRGAFNARPSDAQLVGCFDRVGETPTDITCSYIINDRVPFARASHRVTVRAARTGETVDQFMIDTAAGGCPGEATVNLAGPKVWSSPTTGQYLQALRRYTDWDGKGRPPTVPTGAATPRNAGGRVLDSGSVRLTAPPGADAPTLAVLQDYLAFWSAYEAAREQGRPVTADLQAVADPRFLLGLSSTLSDQRRVPRGPVLLTPGIRTRTPGTVIVDDCVDETGREYTAAGERTGEVGIRSAVGLTMAAQGDRFVATGFVDAPADLCPVDAG